MVKEKLYSVVKTFQTRELHNKSLMEMATTLKVLDTVPPLRPYPEIVATAARLGGSYDNCCDLGINRREAEKAHRTIGEKGLFQATPSYLIQYQRAFNVFVEKVDQSSLNEDRKSNMIKTSCMFTQNLATIELCALFLPEAKWSPQKTIKYRRAVCLLWAMYFSALGSEKKLQLVNFNIGEGINGPENHYSVHLKGTNRESTWVKNLYYGSVVYQLVCDWIGKRFNEKRFIPGFASLNQESQGVNHQEYKNILCEYISKARENGMSISENLVLRYVFPTFRSLANLRVKT